METELVGDFSGVHGVGEILLVGKDEEEGVPEFVLIQHTLEFLAGLGNTLSIVGIDDEDDTLGVLEVMPPEGSDLVLSSDVPDGEGDVLVLDGLDVEANGRDSGDDFTKLELVEDCGLAGGIKTNHQDAHFALAKEAGEEL